jgi:hypothetical protein
VKPCENNIRRRVIATHFDLRHHRYTDSMIDDDELLALEIHRQSVLVSLTLHWSLRNSHTST